MFYKHIDCIPVLDHLLSYNHLEKLQKDKKDDLVGAKKDTLVSKKILKIVMALKYLFHIPTIVKTFVIHSNM